MISNTNSDDLTGSKKKFQILLMICLIAGILVVSGFIIYHALTPEPGYITFGILNEDKKAENYPTNASINENISFYLTVGNYLNREFSFRIEIKKGNYYTILTPPTHSNGTLSFIVGDFTLKNKADWISEQLNVSFSEVGENQIIIAELWEIKPSTTDFYDKLWLRLNITT